MKSMNQKSAGGSMMPWRLYFYRVSKCLLLVSALCWLAPAVSAGNDRTCAQPIVGARYTLTQQNAKATVTADIFLRRTETLWVFPDLAVAELWDPGAAGRPKLTRYFDDHQRGIEYQPEEVEAESARLAFMLLGPDGCRWVEQLVFAGEAGRQTWTLKDVVKDKNIAAAAFTQRERYLTVDYADIGDNETDAFFRSTIHLGFKAPHRH
jgi:hypothetical protein